MELSLYLHLSLLFWTILQQSQNKMKANNSEHCELCNWDFFYCVLGSTTEFRMQENLPIDYSTIYGHKESEQYGAANVMIPEALAKNLTQK